MNAFSAEASRVLANAVQKPGKPFFLYYAQQEIHAPVQVPPSPDALAKCANVTSSVGRKTLCSMAVTMDDELHGLRWQVMGSKKRQKESLDYLDSLALNYPDAFSSETHGALRRIMDAEAEAE